MEPVSSEASAEGFEEVPAKRSRKKVQLVSLEAEPEQAAPKKRVRKKLPEEETEPTSVAFTSAKGAVSFSARKKAKVPEVEAKVAEMEAPPPQPLVRHQAQPQQIRVQAPPAPGLYDMLHEHLSSRGAERSQRWSQFLVA